MKFGGKYEERDWGVRTNQWLDLISCDLYNQQRTWSLIAVDSPPNAQTRFVLCMWWVYMRNWCVYMPGKECIVRHTMRLPALIANYNQCLRSIALRWAQWGLNVFRVTLIPWAAKQIFILFGYDDGSSLTQHHCDPFLPLRKLESSQGGGRAYKNHKAKLSQREEEVGRAHSTILVERRYREYSHECWYWPSAGKEANGEDDVTTKQGAGGHACVRGRA